VNLPVANPSISTEVTERPTRRRHSLEFKKRILDEYERCAKGERGALLRRHGLYSSHIDGWRKQRDAGVEEALMPKKRGRKAEPSNPLSAENAELRRKLARAERALTQAHAIIDIQKKVAEALGLPLQTIDGDESDESK
jgi:transposase-like protein